MGGEKKKLNTDTIHIRYKKIHYTHRHCTIIHIDTIHTLYILYTLYTPYIHYTHRHNTHTYTLNTLYT